VLPLALHLAIHRRRRLDLLPAFILGFAMPLAVSRSGILAVGLALLIMFCYWPSAVRRRALIVAPVAVVALRVIVPGLVGTIYSLFRGIATDPSVTGRTDDYGVGFSLYQDQAWFGRGLFTFVPGYYRILDNQLLMVLVELGAVGLVAVLLLFIGSYGSALGARRRALDPRDSHVSLAIAASIAGMLAASVTFDSWGFAQAAGLTFLLFGMAGAASRLSHEDAAVEVPAPARGLVLEGANRG
jgi:O-antigen ligase